MGKLFVMVFANSLLPYQDFKITGDKTLRASTVNKLTIPGLIINSLITLYRESANIHQSLYLDCKNTCHTLLAPGLQTA